MCPLALFFVLSYSTVVQTQIPTIYEETMMSDNVFRGVVIVTLVAISTCVGFGAYRVLKLDESVEQLRGLDSGSSAVVLPGVPAETKKCEVVEETIITRQNPWESLQPKVKDTVVQIFSQIAAFNWLEPYKTPNHGQAFGSGFLIDEEGHIITNAHVVKNAKSVQVLKNNKFVNEK